MSNDELELEWHILRRMPGDLSSNAAMLDLALSGDKQSMFPNFSAACRKLLLLPIGTASVERSFLTMNRIMNSQRCRLNPAHIRQLMQLSKKDQTFVPWTKKVWTSLNQIKMQIS